MTDLQDIICDMQNFKEDLIQYGWDRMNQKYYDNILQDLKDYSEKQDSDVDNLRLYIAENGL